MSATKNFVIATALAGSMYVSAQEGPACKKFSEIYKNGKELCENMWGGAFKYEENEAEAYTMWHFNADENPNDAITRVLAGNGKIANLPDGKVKQCHLEYYHKNGESHPINNADHPTEDPDKFSVCYPYAKDSCCFADTVSSEKKLKEGYGDEYHWDRCGQLSPACEQFFVMEGCFYECEPNAGIYRKHKADATHPDPFNGEQPLHMGGSEETNTWQLHAMPIKASFCNSWYQACRNDMFCAASGGDFFSCAKAWVPIDMDESAKALKGSCKGACNGKSFDGPCMCDEACEDQGTCCTDKNDVCMASWVPKLAGSCAGSCGKKSKDGTCFCDSLCSKNGDCCTDMAELCETVADGSCVGKCGKKASNCYCDAQCAKQAVPDCCSDFEATCPAQSGKSDCIPGTDC